MQAFLYQEPDTKYIFKQIEDFALSNGKRFVICDGITIYDEMNFNHYETSSDAFKVAQIVAENIVNSGLEFQEATKQLNPKVYEFNKNRELFKKRSTNGFTFGSCVFAAIEITEKSLKYSVLDDCMLTVLDKDCKIIYKSFPHVSQAYSLIKDLPNNLDTRYYWRGQIRNNSIQDIGYGAVDGIGDYTKYLQQGELELESGYTIVLYSDGAINLLNNPNVMDLLIHEPIGVELYKKIAKLNQINFYDSEKSLFVIRI